MQYTFSALAPAFLAASLVGQDAQKVEIDTKSSNENTVRYTIQAEFETSSSREMLINGEAPDFGGGGGGRGGFGGGGESSSMQKVVFDQGPKGANWRQYHTVESLDIREGRDGEPMENTVEGALAGKRVRVSQGEDGETTLIEGDGEDGKVLSANLGRNVAQRVDLSGMVPSGSVVVGSEFELAHFRDAIQGIAHPVAADRQGGGRGGNAGGGRRGGGEEGEPRRRRGGEQGGGEGRGRRGGGEGQEGGRGFGGGRGGRFRRGGGASGTAMQLLHNNEIPCKATGTLVAIEEKDGRRMAKISLKASIKGEGDAEELGIQAAGGFGGRGGRGGRGARGGGGDAGTTTANVDLAITGEAWVDLETQMLTSLSLKGKIDYETKSQRVFDRQGEEMEIDSTNSTEGTFRLKVSCAKTQGN